MIFAWLSATPSLLPRGPFQGVVTGGSAAIGYLGVFAAWIVRYLLSRETRWPSPGPRVWAVTGIVAIVGTVIMVIFWYSTGSTTSGADGVEQLSWWAYPTIIVVAVVVFVILMALGRAGRH